MSQRIKLTHVITALNVGGAEVMLCRLLEKIDRSRFDCSVICLGPRGVLSERIERAGIPLTTLGMRGPLSLLSGLWKMTRLFRREKPDAVHTWMYHGDFMGGLAAKLGGNPPVAWAIHHTTHAKGGIKWTTRALTWLLARLSHWVPRHIFCCSHATQREHERIGYRGDNMEVIVNGADLEVCQPSAEARAKFRAELNIPGTAPVIGAAGRFHPQKDYPNFFEAALLLQQIRPDVHFVLCGKGLTADNPEIAPYLARSPHPERFHLLGLRGDMPSVYPALDLFALAAAFGEGWPLTIGEALACGVPCVATDLGDCKDLIGDCGEAVPCKDPAALSAAWARLLALSPAETSTLKQRCRQRIVDHFNIDDVIRQYETAYEKLAARGSQKPAPETRSCEAAA